MKLLRAGYCRNFSVWERLPVIGTFQREINPRSAREVIPWYNRATGSTGHTLPPDTADVVIRPLPCHHSRVTE